MGVRHGLVLLLLVACGDADSPAPSERAEDEREAEGSEAAPSAVPTENCLTDLRGATPPELRDALDGLGWRSAYEDACAMASARASGDPAACDALALHRLREPCRDRVAISSGNHSACSLDGDEHDTFCVALSARRASLCRAVPLGRRAACEAILGTRAWSRPDETRCDHHDVPDAEVCHEIFQSFAPLVPAERIEAGRTELSVHLRTVRSVPLGSGRSESEPEEDELGESEHGATLTWDGCERIVRAGDDHGEPLPRRPRWFVEARLSGPLPAQVRSGEGARIEVARESFQEATAGSIAGGDATVEITRLEPELGGRLDLTVRGSLSRSPGEVEVELEVETIVRDVIGTPGEGCE